MAVLPEALIDAAGQVVAAQVNHRNLHAGAGIGQALAARDEVADGRNHLGFGQEFPTLGAQTFLNQTRRTLHVFIRHAATIERHSGNAPLTEHGDGGIERPAADQRHGAGRIMADRNKVVTVVTQPLGGDLVEFGVRAVVQRRRVDVIGDAAQHVVVGALGDERDVPAGGFQALSKQQQNAVDTETKQQAFIADN